MLIKFIQLVEMMAIAVLGDSSRLLLTFLCSKCDRLKRLWYSY
jgi:hypothetical protein